jgi:hypothetical protein
MATDTPSSRFLHPASGALILGLDWLLFSGSALTLGLSTPMLALIGFALGGVGTGLIQARYGQDKNATSMLKGLLGGLAVGIPLPIAGTAVGGGILTLSGLDRLRGSDDEESRRLSEKDRSQ